MLYGTLVDAIQSKFSPHVIIIAWACSTALQINSKQFEIIHEQIIISF